MHAATIHQADQRTLLTSGEGGTWSLVSRPQQTLAPTTAEDQLGAVYTQLTAELDETRSAKALSGVSG